MPATTPLKRRRTSGVGDFAETQRVDRANRPRPHREDIAHNAADSRGGALERLDGARMVVRLDFEGDGQTVADVDDAGVFLAGADQDSRRPGGKGLEERLCVFIGAMLAPHHGEYAQFGVRRLAAEDLLDVPVFLRSQAVFVISSGVMAGSIMGVSSFKASRALGRKLGRLLRLSAGQPLDQAVKNQPAIGTAQQVFAGPLGMRHKPRNIAALAAYAGDVFQRAVGIGRFAGLALSVHIAPQNLLVRFQTGERGGVGKIATLAMSDGYA